MLARRLLAISLSVILILSLAAPAFAQANSTNYQRFFDVDGDISMKIQAGSDYSEAGKHQAIAEGVGRLERYDFIRMGGGSLKIENMSDWEADPDSLRGLEVASSFWLNDDDEENDAASLVYDEESEQVFAVSVDADPGEEGHLSQDISSAENSFEIEQHAETSDGTFKRYIDLVDPDSGEYLYEDTEIKGYAVVVDKLSSDADNDEDAEEVEVFQFSNPDAEEQDEETEKEMSMQSSEKEDISEQGESILKLAGDDLFETEVPPGTEVDKLGMPESIELTTEMFKVTGIEIEWHAGLLEEFDSEVEGHYVFIGELIFPENVEVPEPVIVDYTVHVTEEAEENDAEQKEKSSGDEDEKSDEESTEKDYELDENGGDQKESDSDSGEGSEKEEESEKEELDKEENDA